jgi:hypothetical protein
MCGQACYVWEATKLSPDTGRGGLIVCANDADKIDFGLVPYAIPPERPVEWTRINHRNVTNGTEPLDVEASGVYS